MNVRLLAFCFRSLHSEYGAEFLLRVALRHPVATLCGIRKYARGGCAGEWKWEGGPRSLLGVGFCLKPIKPACPSGRANHDCRYLEGCCAGEAEPCRSCLIRSIGERALQAGCPVYVMTSASDMLADVIVPALEQRRYNRAILTMCRYSFEPIRLAMAICGIETRLIPFVDGDCRDYATWRQADTGSKSERTLLDSAGEAELMEALSAEAAGAAERQCVKRGHVYEPA